MYMDVQQRVLNAISGEKMPDRVPIFVPAMYQSVNDAFTNETGKKPKLGKCLCNNIDLTPLTNLGVDICEVPGPPHIKPETPLPRLDTDLILDKYGRIFSKRNYSGINFLIYQGPYLITEDKIKDWDHIRIDTIQNGWEESIYDEIINCIDKHEMCPVFKVCDGLYSKLEEGVGIENTALLLHDYPDFVDLHLEKIHKICYHDAKTLLNAGAAFLMIEDDITIQNRPIITPDLVQEYLLKYYKKIVELIHDKGGIAFFKTKGDVLNVIDTILDAGFDVIHITQPDQTYLEELKVFYGDKITVMGNLDVLSMLSYGTPVQVRKNVYELMNFAKSGGKYIFGTNGDLPSSTSLANLVEMVSSAKRYGTY